ncbi:hypothetical protein JHK87_003732 [Glycine soja]|nr:hypothetical protein JHK87_003732 [Glycine soja]
MAAKLEDSKHKLQIWLINDSLTQLASHGLFDVHVKATGDVHIDDHHTNEDVPLLLEQYALLQALGDRKGINRVGNFSAPLDEALIHVSLHFFESLVNTSGMTLHIWQAGKHSKLLSRLYDKQHSVIQDCTKLWTFMAPQPQS